MAKAASKGRSSGSGEWIKYAIGLAGGIIGFVIGKWDTLLDIFVGTTIAVTTSAGLDPTAAKIRIEGITAGTSELDDAISLDLAKDGVTVMPGLYNINLVQADLILSTRTAEVARGTNVAVDFTDRDLKEEWQRKQKIDVSCVTDRDSYRPGETIVVNIAAAGVGYLWIEEIDEQGNVTGSYPPIGQDAGLDGQNVIGPQRSVSFPTAAGEGFVAEGAKGSYRLVCLVTSSPNRAEADSIFHQIVGVSTKGYGTLGTNWGYGVAAYSVAPLGSE